MSKRTAAASTRIRKAEQAAKKRRNEMIDVVLTEPGEEVNEPYPPDPTQIMSAEEARMFLNPKSEAELSDEEKVRIEAELESRHGEGPPWDGDSSFPSLAPGVRTVTLIRDHALEYPELYLQVFIAGTKFEERHFAEMFARSNCSRAKDLYSADLCVFTGGVDVDPALYGETPHPKTHIQPSRDQADIETYKVCLEEGIPMFGVCRGMQFLHVMQKGKLFQHIDNHTGDHSIRDLVGKVTIDRVSSIHHQSCRPNKSGGMQIIATAVESRNRWLNGKTKAKGPNVDIEALWYRDACCFGVQGHPEYKDYNFYTVWTLKKIYEYVMLNPDVDWVDGARRIKPDILAQRKLNWNITDYPNGGTE